MEANRRTIGPLEPTLPCLEPSCIRRFYNRNGRSNHMRSWHPNFVPDVQQQPPASEANAPTFKSTPDSQMSSPPTYNRSLDSCHGSQSRGSDHNASDHNDDHNSADGSELPRDDFNDDLDIHFDGGEYQLNDGNPEPSNAGSYDQAHDSDPVVPQAGPSINRTYHPIINGIRSLFYYHYSILLTN
jgi:hypothetical protein